tara:strand:+ start:892 stop:1407 length:516 start_codon:yes stop_codon:yes gene_type:complete
MEDQPGKEEVGTQNEEIKTEVNTEVKVKKQYVMTEARQENLRKARLKATLLREQLKEKRKVEPKPKSKMEKKLEALEEAKKTEADNKDGLPTEPAVVDDKIMAGDLEDVKQLENPQPKSATRKEETKPVHKPSVEPVVDTPKVVAPPKEVAVEPPIAKPKLYRREGHFLYM